MTMTKGNAIKCLFLLLLLIVTFFLPGNLSFHAMFDKSIIYLIILIFIVCVDQGEFQFFSFIFILLNWIFNCGHFFCIVFSFEQEILLDIRNYGTLIEINNGFKFYLLSQILYSLGVIFFYGRKNKTNGLKIFDGMNMSKIAKILILIGIIPRVYIDVMKIVGSLSNGYAGVYSLSIPSFIQSLGFLFNAGIIFYMIAIKDRKKNQLFIIITIAKLIVMFTGSRQESTSFLIIWCYLFFKNNNVFTLKNKIKMGMFGFMLIYLLNLVGNLRTASQLQISFLFDAATSFDFMKLVSGLFGEFGSSFSTLIVSMNNVPSILNYGFGKSYIAGLLSVIPTLISSIPSLKESAVFITSLPSKITYSFGGSVLGELYYNFGWFGFIFCIIIGYYVGKCSYLLSSNENNNEKYFYSVLSFVLLLLIRGYFCDYSASILTLMLIIWIERKTKIFKNIVI